MSHFRKLARKVKRRLLDTLHPGRKSESELHFWQEEIVKYQRWFLGELKCLYRTPSPWEEQKVAAPNLKDASVLTWHKLCQEMKYLADLELGPDALRGKRVLDVGSGPIPSATCFKDIQLYCLDPLLPDYVKAGFPLHYYENVHFVHGFSENMPLSDAFFDVVIAVNSIDHVDDIKKTAKEIQRVLKPGGLIRMHVHYHRATITEPLEFDDAKVADLFSWCQNFRKLGVHPQSYAGDLPPDEKFVLWSNFP
jgi:SAM-dependent methyltransferase